MSGEATTRGDGEKSSDTDHPCYVVKERAYYSFWSHTWVLNEPKIINGVKHNTTYKVCSVCGKYGTTYQGA